MLGFDIIIKKEAENEGADIYLYYDDAIGFYVAYGFSAFLADHIADGPKSFSTALMKPVMILHPTAVIALRNATQKLEHKPKEYYHFALRYGIAADGYAKWEEELKSKVL